MSVKWIQKKTRLATMIDESGGVTVGKALEHADELLGDLKAESLQVVEAAIVALEAMTKAAPANPGPWLEEIYRLAAEVLKGVGPFGLEDMAKASFSLSELADRFREGGRCELAPVQVHVQSLRLLLASGEQLPAAARAEILRGLDGVLARAPRVRIED
jgi:hypothetical protein